MSEEEIIEAVNYQIRLVNKKGWCSIGKEELQDLLDLYNKQKENNKKLQEGYDKRVREILKLEQRIEELEEIEEEHRKENGKLQEKINEYQKTNSRLQSQLKITRNMNRDILKSLKDSVSKETIKEKINETENHYKVLERLYPNTLNINFTKAQIEILKELIGEEMEINELMDFEVMDFKDAEWKRCINIIKEHWNLDYGSITETKNLEGEITIELTTGGWSENERLIRQIQDTIFWILFWQESKRGGYYKFIYSEVIKYE